MKRTSNARDICPIFSARHLQMTRARQCAKIRVIQPGPFKLNPQADAWWVGLYLFLRKVFFLVHPNGHSAKTSKIATAFILSIQIFSESLCMIFKENMGMILTVMS